jgi:hypothetical protein
MRDATHTNAYSRSIASAEKGRAQRPARRSREQQLRRLVRSSAMPQCPMGYGMVSHSSGARAVSVTCCTLRSPSRRLADARGAHLHAINSAKVPTDGAQTQGQRTISESPKHEPASSSATTNENVFGAAPVACAPHSAVVATSGRDHSANERGVRAYVCVRACMCVCAYVRVCVLCVLCVLCMLCVSGRARARACVCERARAGVVCVVCALKHPSKHTLKSDGSPRGT